MKKPEDRGEEPDRGMEVERSAAAFEPIDVAGWAVCFLAERYRETFVARFNLESEVDDIVRYARAARAVSAAFAGRCLAARFLPPRRRWGVVKR